MMSPAAGKRSVEEKENHLYKCKMIVAPPKACRLFLMGCFGSVKLHIGHFSCRDAAEFISQLSVVPLL